jgi:hypothetical protein
MYSSEPTSSEWQEQFNANAGAESDQSQDSQSELLRLKRQVARLTADKRTLIERLVRTW